MTQQSPRRERIFAAGVRAVNRVLAPSFRELQDRYLCPLCMVPYGPDALSDPVRLTLEDVPSKKSGIRPVKPVLTCRECNSAWGAGPDAHLARKTRATSLKRGEIPPSVQIAIPGHTFWASARRIDDTFEFTVPRGRISPAAQEAFVDYVPGQVQVIPTRGYSERYAALALLKAAFLLGFAMWGYLWVLSHPVLALRMQLADPSARLIDVFHATVESLSGVPDPGVAVIDEPTPFALVRFGEGVLIIPRHSSPIDLYGVLGRGSDTGAGRLAIKPARVRALPTDPEFALDVRSKPPTPDDWAMG